MLKKLYHYFSRPKQLSILNTLLICAMIAGNTWFQVFCVPVNWAIVLLALCSINLLVFALSIKKPELVPLVSFTEGLTFCILAYCIIFLGSEAFLALGLVLFGIGILGIAPYFLAAQVCYRNLVKPASERSRVYFLSAVCCCLCLAVYAGILYKKAIYLIHESEQEGFQALPRTYMTERIVGMHFIYHTEVCLYDGRRPPRHDPFMVTGMWLNHGYDPLHVDLPHRVALYEKFFPYNSYRYDCRCAIKEQPDFLF